MATAFPLPRCCRWQVPWLVASTKASACVASTAASVCDQYRHQCLCPVPPSVLAASTCACGHYHGQCLWPVPPPVLVASYRRQCLWPVPQPVFLTSTAAGACGQYHGHCLWPVPRPAFVAIACGQDRGQCLWPVPRPVFVASTVFTEKSSTSLPCTFPHLVSPSTQAASSCPHKSHDETLSLPTRSLIKHCHCPESDKEKMWLPTGFELWWKSCLPTRTVMNSLWLPTRAMIKKWTKEKERKKRET